MGNIRTEVSLTTDQICELLSAASVFELYAEHNQVYHGTLGSQRVDEKTGYLYVTLYGTEYCIAYNAEYKATTYANGVTSIALKQSELVIV